MGVKHVPRHRPKRRLIGTEFLYNIHHGGCFLDNPYRYEGGTITVYKILDYCSDWGSFVEFMRARGIWNISRIFFQMNSRPLSKSEDVRLIWDVNSSSEAVLLLFDKREINLYCESGEGVSMYDPIVQPATVSGYPTTAPIGSRKRKLEFDNVGEKEGKVGADRGKGKVVDDVELREDGDFDSDRDRFLFLPREADSLDEYQSANDQEHDYDVEPEQYDQDLDDGKDDGAGHGEDEDGEGDKEEDDVDYENEGSQDGDEDAMTDLEQESDDEGMVAGYESDYARSGEEVDAIEDVIEIEDGVESAISFRRTKFPRFVKGACHDFVRGMHFTDKKELKELATAYAVKYHRDIHFKKSDKSRAEIRCVDGCPFRVWASYTKKLMCWQIKVIQEEHMCNKVHKLKLATSKWLAKKFFSELRADPSMKRKEFKENVKKGLKIEITKKMAKRVKRVFRSNSKGTSSYEYSLLKDYMAELIRTNPGGTFILGVYPTEDGVTERFRRMYICFDACKRGFKEGCRKIFGVDGCFLKSATKGQMLTTIGRDANDQMYPIAWAIVAIENKESWLWFLTLLKCDLGIEDDRKWVIQSDQQKGLIPALKTLLPNVEHRLCARHILTNWQKKHPGDVLKGYFWNYADSTNEREFIDNLELIAQYPNAKEDLLRTDPHHWSKAFFTKEVKCDSNQNNICEAFNGVDVVLKAREKPIYSLCEDIRKYMMVRFNEKRIYVGKWKTEIGPHIMKKLDESVKDYNIWRVTFNGVDGYEVSHDLDQHKVHLDSRTCSCGKWDLTGIPCDHAACCIINRDYPLEPYVDDCYRRAAFMRAYNYSFEPVGGPNVWPHTDALKVSEPVVKRLFGRPKMKRVREPDEITEASQGPRKSTYQVCSVCKLPGHNKRKCAFEPGSGSGSLPSNKEPSAPYHPQPRRGKNTGIGVYTLLDDGHTVYNPGRVGQTTLHNTRAGRGPPGGRGSSGGRGPSDGKGIEIS